VLFLSPGIVDWLQALLHWCNNNAVFIVDVSKVCANSRPQKTGKKQNMLLNTKSLLIATKQVVFFFAHKSINNLLHQIFF